MASYIKGVALIAVEDDAIQMLHGIVELSDEGCEAVGFSPLEFLPRPLTSTSDGTSPMPGQSEDTLLDWREHAPYKVKDHIIEFISDCLDQGKPVDAVGVSTFGNVSTKSNQSLSYVSSQGENAGEIYPIDIPRDVKSYFGKKLEPDLDFLIVNDATAMAVGESLNQREAGVERPDLFACIWLGKGVNGGVVFKDNRAWHGFMHPEMGHILPRLHSEDTAFIEQIEESGAVTSCITHKDCLMSLVSRRSILKRRENGMSDETIEDIISYYVAQLCLSITFIAVPGRIAIDGYLFRSNMLSVNFIANVRAQFKAMLNGFPVYPQIFENNIDSYIVSALGSDVSSLRGLEKMMRDKLWADHRKNAFESAETSRKIFEKSK